MAENSQYWPEVQTGVDLIERGAIGELLTAKACFNMRKPPEVYAEEGGKQLHTQSAGYIVLRA